MNDLEKNMFTKQVEDVMAKFNIQSAVIIATTPRALHQIVIHMPLSSSEDFMTNVAHMVHATLEKELRP